jgi:DNA polymerase type B, organellar and viral
VNSSSIRLRRPERDPQFEIAANGAYYGGRFEVSHLGLLSGPIYEYDLRSAYPAAMLDLLCPLHTRWENKPRVRRLPAGEVYVAKVTFSHSEGLWCGLPFRQNGGLFWPFQGTGWYWSIEIEAARQFLSANFTMHDLWIARRECDCRPFDWVSELYEERRRIGSDTRGYPLKLGLNSLYGKMAQRCGRGPYHDAVSAGLITALTRVRLFEALGQDPEAVVMLATDAVFSRRLLALDIGKGLGQWECHEWPDLFIAQPGVYWSPSNLSELVKSRGVRRSVIGDAAPRFVEVWNEWHALLRQRGARELILAERQIPSVPVTVRVFNGCRIALHRGKPWLAGKWEDVSRHESFEWRTKRDPNRITVCDAGYIVTFPRIQSAFAESEGYKPADFDKLVEISGENGRPEEIDENMLLEAMPDHIPFLPHE